MRLKSDSAIEYRRQLMLKLHQEGKTQQEIADTVGLSQSKVSVFLTSYRLEGENSIKVKKAKGNLPRLSTEQIQELKSLLEQGAEFHEYESNHWDRKRVKDLIEVHFGVSYSVHQVGNILKKIGYTVQKCMIKDYRQSKEKVDDFLTNKVPDIKKR